MSGRQGFWKNRLFCAASAGAVLIASPAWAQALAFKIPSQPAATGITEFARQAGVQVLVPEEATRGKRTSAVIGALPLNEALTHLLAGTGLVVMSNDGRTITLTAPQTALIKTGWAGQAAPSSAESAAPLPVAPPPAAAQPALQEVVVTGTRLTAGNFTTPTPVTSIGAPQIQTLAQGSVYDVLKYIPELAATTGPSQASTGAQNASKSNPNLLNLGANRTLVLINGQRHVADGQSNVFDTNLLPVNLIDHIDVVTGGASAAYGSDAVAGVVNFVMKKRMDGFTGDIHVGMSQRGDDYELYPSFAYGRSFLNDRLHFIIGGDYTHDNGTHPALSARSWGALEPGEFSIATSSISTAQRVAMGLPANIISNHVETSGYNSNGLITGGPLKGIAFGPGGSTSNFNYGTINGGTEMIGGGDYGSVLNPDEDLQAAFDRAAAMSRIEYDINDTTIAYGQVQYGVLHTFGDSFGARVPNFNAYPVQINNPYLPASVVTAMRAANVTSFPYSATRDDDLSSIASRNRTETLQGNFGISGQVWDGWKWNIDGGVGKATFAPDIHNTPITADFYESAYVVPGPNGTPVCGPVATNPYFNSQPAIVKAQLQAQVTPGCVPYNIFGANKAQNQAALAYFNNASQEDNEFRQYTAQADLAGTPFVLPAGPVSLATGVEWRKDTLSAVNCAECMLGALMNQNYSNFSGAISVVEGYAEVGVPLLKDYTLIKALDFNGAVRETDYSTSGAVTTWKVGGTWDLNDMIRLRLTRSQDIRAPNVNELFNPGSTGNPVITNPANNQSGYIKSNTIGNPNLVPEVAQTWTAGVIFKPTWSWASGFRASFDTYSIVVRNVISTLAIQNLINSAFAGNTSLQKYITYDNSALGIAAVNIPELNLNSLKTDGFNVEIDYNIPINEINLPGHLTTRLLANYTGNNKTLSSAGNLNAVDGATAPRFFMTDALTYTLERFSINLISRYTSPIKYNTNLIGPDDPAYTLANPNSINRNLWPVPMYFDSQIGYDVLKGDGKLLHFYFNINNIFDKQPPIVALPLSGGPYDLIGRAFKLGVRFNY
jgi:iron complex outermembrane receptor protein